MPTPRKDKLEKFKKGEYKGIFVQVVISPIMYKNMIDSMERLGLSSESAYLKMAIQAFNHNK